MPRKVRLGIAALILALAPVAQAVEIKSPVGLKDAGLEYAIADGRRLLVNVTGRISLAIDGTMDPLARRVATGRDGEVKVFAADAMSLAHALYWYLERFAGVRWYASDTEKLPSVDRLPTVNCIFRPAIPYRETWGRHDGLDLVWRFRNRATKHAIKNMEISNGSPSGCHSFEHYLESVTNAALFGVQGDGKPCHTLCLTNPEVRRLVAERMLNYIAEDRKKRAGAPSYAIPRVYELSQLDGSMDQACMCKDCEAMYRREGSYAGLNIDFANAVARIVRKRYPDVFIRTFAYSYTELPPKTVKADDNVIVRFCRSFLFAPLVKGSYNGDVLEAWRQCAKNLCVWSYWRMYSGPTIPAVKSRADISAEMRFCRDCGVSGYFAEYEDPMSLAFSPLMEWLRLEFADDPDRDVYRLADEFMTAYYGAASKPMTAYLSYLERRFADMRSRLDADFLKRTNSGDLAMFTVQDYLDRAFFEKVNAWLDDAERLVAGDVRLLRHVHAERVIVDRAMFDNLAELRRHGYSFDAKRTARRFRQNLRETVWNWNRFDESVRRRRLDEADREAALYERLPVPLPTEFEGDEVVEYNYNRIGNGAREIVADVDAVAGFAVRRRKAGKTEFPFHYGLYSDVFRRQQFSELKESEVPADGKYHLYKAGEETMLNPLRVVHDGSWALATWLPSFGVVPDRREIWLSMKITADDVRIDRLFVVKRRQKAAKRDCIECDTLHPFHCQGVANDGRAIYWSFSTELVKTDLSGKTLGKYVMPGGHMGDLCVHAGKVFVGMNMGSAADGARVGDEVWVFDAETLKLEKKIPTPETVWCNNGLEWYGGSFWIVTNASKEMPYNHVFEYTSDFRFKCCHPIASGRTYLGVQTICQAKGRMLFGCYGGTAPDGEKIPHCVFSVDFKDLAAGNRNNESPSILKVRERRDGVDGAEGLMELDGELWLARGFVRKDEKGTGLYGAKLVRSSDFDGQK